MLALRVDSPTTATEVLRSAARGVHLVLRLDLPSAERGSVVDQLGRIADVRFPGESVRPTADPGDQTVRLDAEQLGLVRRLAAGATVTEAAAELSMSRRTAYRRLNAAIDALSASSPLDAVRRAVAAGLIDPSHDPD